jgi:hypothetical protein
MAVSYFYSTPVCAAATNAPNLVSMPVFQARAAGTASTKGNIPQFDVQKTAAGCSTAVPNLVPVPVFAAAAVCRCSLGQLPRLFGRLAESSPQAVVTNQFTGNSHRIITPLSFLITVADTYIDSISWSGMLGAGHVMELYDAQGTLLSRLVSGQASDSNFAYVPVGRVARGGYRVPALDSGVLLVTIGRKPRNIYSS